MADREKMSRRAFLERTAIAGIGVAAGIAVGSTSDEPASAAPAAAHTPLQQATQLAESAVTQAPSSKRSSIAIIHSPSVLVNNKVNRDKCLQMLDVAVKHVFGTDDAAAAWRQVAKPDDVVAIKVNCISGVLFSNVVLTAAICQRLQEAGVVPENIIVFDRSTGELKGRGFTINRGGPGVQIYGTDGDYSAKFDHRTYKDRLSKIITEKASVIINVPVLKDHGGAQVTLAMKNHYGSIDNPGPYHGNNCDPYIADINDIPEIKDKTRLIVCDAIRGCFQHGPGPNPGDLFTPASLIVGRDPVACDTLGTMMIDAERAKHGLPPLGGEGKLPKHIVTAAGYGLGTNNLQAMNVLKTSV